MFVEHEVVDDAFDARFRGRFAHQVEAVEDTHLREDEDGYARMPRLHLRDLNDNKNKMARCCNKSQEYTTAIV